MDALPQPVIFEPILKPKPWGGRRLATLFDKPLPADQPIGESWEIASLPDNESHVASGPLSNRAIGALVDAWGERLLGGAALAHGRFPLLIKLLDSNERVSVQVHPKPAENDPVGLAPGIKHEAWYIIHAEPDARVYIGLKPGVRPDDVAGAANSPAIAEMLRARPARPGDCFYLPSGTLHALGAGITMAEVQTPSDVTYRLYDWGRVGLDGKPRELHIEQTLANIAYDVPESQIAQPARPVRPVCPGATATRVAACPRFVIDRVRCEGCRDHPLGRGEMAVWIILSGRGVLSRVSTECFFDAGQTVLIPADDAEIRLTCGGCEWLDVRIPILSP
jgi:mannose-6-phosphate isomerase